MKHPTRIPRMGQRRVVVGGGGVGSLLLVLVLASGVGCAFATATAPSASRQTIPFRYGWRTTNKKADDDNSGPGAESCSFTRPVTASTTCTNLENSPDRHTSDDCRLGCCYEETCFVWVSDGNACMWGGADSVCTNSTGKQAGNVGPRCGVV